VDLAAEGIQQLFQAQQAALAEVSSTPKTMEPQKIEMV
jgi:hypothetical protein